MNNLIYEQTYSKIVEPVYGVKRDAVQDKEFESCVGHHTLSVLTRTNMTMHKSYTIDPDGCTDADDAFSVFTEDGKMYLAIHIADPTTYISLSSALWRDICNRVTTKYPSNRPPIHMMPASILSLAVWIFWSYTAILLWTSPLTKLWSLCALDKKPKIPIEVINIRIAIAANKYPRMKLGALPQFCFNQIVAANLLISNATPITMIGITAAEKIAVRPATE